MRAAVLRFLSPISLSVRTFNALLRVMAAWQGWPLTVIVLGAAGKAVGLPDFVVYLLTVQTAVSASVADITTQHAQVEEAARDAKNEAIFLELRRQSRRSARHDKAILSALESNNELIRVVLERGLKPHVKRRNRQANR